VTIAVIIALATLISTIGEKHQATIIFADVLGYIAAVLVFIQWGPQIITTIINRSPGNFSLTMLFIMMPAAFGTVIYLSVVGKQDVSTW
jgi:uncharacterized protein with PQ loop repeat